MNIIRGAYLNDLLAQPSAVAATINELYAITPGSALHALASRPFERIVLTGMGSSFSALHPLALRLIDQGRTVMTVETSELLHSMRNLLTPTPTLVIAASQSGRSAEIVRLVEEGDRSFVVLAVTNTADSPLATKADAVILTHAGAESTVSCKTYVATLAALTYLGDLMCGEHHLTSMRSTVVASMSGYLDRWEDHVAALLPLTKDVRDVFFAGRGASLAAALTAGLIVKESTRVHAEGMSSAALRHGPMEMAAAHVLALIYEGDTSVSALNQSLVRDLARAGARAHVVGASSDLEALRIDSAASSAARPILEILPAQMISIALAAHAEIEAGRFLHATKVTQSE